jgi:hypothetical protein
MNYGRIVLAGVVAWVASLALGYLINNVWLLHVYQANAWAFRRAGDITPLLPIGFGAQLIACIVFAYAYAKGYEGADSGILEGMRFGLVVAIMVDGFAVVWNYVTEPIALRLGALQMIEHVGEFGVYGGIVGALYAPRPNTESRIPNPESR